MQVSWNSPGCIVLDPYARFTASVSVAIVDPNRVLDVDPLCADCFVWHIRSASGEWTVIREATLINQWSDSGEVIDSLLIIQSARNLKGGHCASDEKAASHLFAPGSSYSLRFRAIFQSNSADEPRVFESDELSLVVGTVPR